MNKLKMSVTFMGVSTILLWGFGATAQEDSPYECDDNFQQCGTPEQSGGGGGGGGGGSIFINNTDVGETYQFADDYDDDGVEDPYDNCPFHSNQEQLNSDGDNFGNVCDNCPDIANALQENIDGDELGDVCDPDRDNDGVANEADSCADNPDPLQNDADGDGMGDACDDDMDNDGLSNLEDECPLAANTAGTSDGNIMCDNDDDGDTIRNTNDNCPQVANYEQEDADADGLGDACDADNDNDGIVNDNDNCPFNGNKDQLDEDRDRVGDACDDAYCFVVYGDNANCLDPTDPFAVYSPSVSGVSTGDSFRVKLFANRSNQPIHYTWEVHSAPSGSSAVVQNAAGDSSVSSPFEYQYAEDSAPLFVPDKPGTYTVRVVAQLVGTDTVTGMTTPSAEAFATITVVGKALDNDSGGCSIGNVGASNAGASTIFVLGLLLLGLAVGRRIR